MNINLQRLIDQNIQQSEYKVIEYNSDETYIRISYYNAKKVIVGVPKEIFKGVSIANIDTISKIIDSSKTYIVKI